MTEDDINKLADLLGLKPGDTVHIRTPQFHREDGVQPVPSLDDWQSLRDQPASVLKSLGCRKWDGPDEAGKCLMLFPHEWYSIIPDNTCIETINEDLEFFKAGETDDDIRFGVLAFGLRVTDDISISDADTETSKGVE